MATSDIIIVKSMVMTILLLYICSCYDDGFMVNYVMALLPAMALELPKHREALKSVPFEGNANFIGCAF